MKKYLVIIACIIFPFIIKAQTDLASSAPQVPVDAEGTIRYVEVVDEDASDTDLFKRCVKWINKEYKNPTTVTPTRDMVNKKIVIRHQFRMQSTTETGATTNEGDVMYDFNLQFKDGRYRLEMTNFVLKTTSRFPAENWLPAGSHPNPINLQKLDEFAREMIASLKQGMKPEKEYVEEEW
jgi:hypothetical protein